MEPRTYIQKSRPLDRHYDPVYTTSSTQTLKPGAPVPTFCGTNGCSYYKRPLRPSNHPQPYIKLRRDYPESVDGPQSQFIRSAMEPETPTGPVSVGVQTQFRDIECQTDPYSPEYYIANSDEEGIPELFELGLHELTFANGQLPAGFNSEIEAITNIAEKQKFLENLPEATDPTSFKQRKRMLEESELKEWKYREELIERENAQRLRLIQASLLEQNETLQQVMNARLATVREEKEAALREHKQQIHQSRIKHIQQSRLARDALLNKIALDPNRNSKHDIVELHADFGSSLYAPVKRDGKRPIMGPKVEVREVLPIENFEEIQPPDLDEVTGLGREEVLTAAGQRDRADMQTLDSLLLGARQEPGEEGAPATAQKSYQPTQRPKTPCVEAEPQQDRAVCQVQALLRGRSTNLKIERELKQNRLVVREIRKTEQTRKGSSLFNMF